jgi:catecholate siderophore receptor
MSSVRVPGSLRRIAGNRRSEVKPAAAPKRESRAATLFTAALLTAASPISIAVAQGTLPPLKVETAQPKKKAKPAPTGPSADTKAAQPLEAQSLSPGAKDANPYANPNAPYNVERSASSKLTEPLVNTPRTVTAIPRQVIEDKAATSIRDLARQTPGVTIGFAEGGNAFGDSIYIRGFQARGDIFIDGLRDPGNTSRDLFAVEQIEIYKGPGSVISGRGTPGGAINIITKQPNEQNNFYNVSQMFGTDHTFRTMVDVNQIIGPGLTVRGNVMYHESDVAGRDFADDQRWGGFFSALFRPSETFKLTVDYYRFRSDGTPDWGVPINPATKLPWTESGVPRDTWYGNALRDFIKNDSDVVTAKAEIKLAPNVLLTSRTRYGVNVADYIASFPQDPNPNDGVVNVGNPQRYQEFESISHQSDVTFRFSTAGLQHTLVAGVELARDNVGRHSYSGLQSPPSGTVSLTDPDPYRGFAAVGPRTLTFDAKIDTTAAYLLDTIKLSPQWFINGGIRWDSFERDQIGSGTNTGSREERFVTWHAGIVYKPIPIASIYAAYATAVNPIGGELDATGAQYGGLSGGTALLDPEESTGIEVGTKWELFNRRVLATAALFQTEKSHARENSGTTSNAEYRVRGVELGIQGSITERWSVYGGLVILESEVLKSDIPRNVGRRMANVADHQFSLLTKYALTDKLTIGGQAVYSSEVFAGHLAAADNGYHTVPYWRFDAMAEYQFTQNFSAQINVLNLTNELYYDALYQSNTANVFVAPGRVGYLTLHWKY